MSALMKAIRKNPDGFTVDQMGNAPVHGYVVAPVKEAEKRVPRDFITEAELDAFAVTIHQIQHASRGQRVYAGGWMNPDDDLLYLDVCLVYDPKTQATYIARSAHQIGFYDVGEQDVIITQEEIDRLKATGLYDSGEYGLSRRYQKEIARRFREIRDSGR